MVKYLLVMGICGTGKSTIGESVATALDVPFIEADKYHSDANVQKMSAGISLTDDDRFPWLQAIAQVLYEHQNTGFVLACSALKKQYRDIIASLLSHPLDIYLLEGSQEVIAHRMHNRSHFMPISMITSQLDALEITSDLHSINIEVPVEQIINEILAKYVV